MNKPITKVYVVAEEVERERIHPQDSIWSSSYKTLNAAKCAVEKDAIDLFYEYFDEENGDETPPSFIEWGKNKFSPIWFGEAEVINYTIIETKLK